MNAEETTRQFRDAMEAIRAEIGKVMVGQDETVLGALIGLVAGGHILLEGAPGLGKTLLVRSLAQAVDMKFSRIQFTPDLMPADITGTNILVDRSEGGREFAFQRGPLFTNILLADEINRATPKTQSALLEAMQEGFVTVGGQRHPLEPPFLVMATQNPIEHEGTYVLPEAQLDRFLLKILVPFPKMSELAAIVDGTTGGAGASIQNILSKEKVVALQKTAREVLLAPPVRDYAIRLVSASHPDSEEASADTKRYVRYGSSPRGAQAIILTSKVLALMAGRFHVSREDIEKAALPALRHRILLNYEAEADGVTADKLIGTLLKHIQSKEKEPIRI